MVPNARTHQHNNEMAVTVRITATYVATWAASLPELMATSDGLTGHYWHYQAPDGNMRAFVRDTIRVLFHNLTHFDDITIRTHKSGRMMHVMRRFGRGYTLTLAYVWAPEADESETETPEEIVNSAVLYAWNAVKTLEDRKAG